MSNNSESRYKLLIADDDIDNVKFLEYYLKRTFEVSTCTNVSSFYEVMKNNKFDIILMDIALKDYKTGLDLTRELKENPESAHIPVVCYSGHVLNSDRINAIKAGCDMFIGKPASNQLLLNSLMSLVEKKNKIENKIN
jgi:DNA-binding response OmpR family regulator